MNEYATLEQLKANLGITDDDDDPILERVLTAASRAVDNYCRRRFWRDPAPVARYFDVSSCSKLRVDDIADATVTVATDADGDGTYETAWAGSDFALLPRNAAADGEPWTHLGRAANSALSFPRGAGRVQVTATFGWPAVPPAVVEATLLQAARWFHRKDTPFAVAEGVSSEMALRLLAALDPDVVVMLADYRREAVFVA